MSSSATSPADFHLRPGRQQPVDAPLIAAAHGAKQPHHRAIQIERDFFFRLAAFHIKFKRVLGLGHLIAQVDVDKVIALQIVKVIQQPVAGTQFGFTGTVGHGAILLCRHDARGRVNIGSPRRALPPPRYRRDTAAIPICQIGLFCRSAGCAALADQLKAGHIHQSAICDFQRRDHRQGKEGQLQKRLVQNHTQTARCCA